MGRSGFKLLSLIAAMSVSSAMAGSGVLKGDIIAQRLSFETKKDHQNWQVKNSKLKLSQRHFKDGKSSLHWQWKNKGQLVLTDISAMADSEFYPGGQPEKFEPSYVPQSRQGGIKLWVYREQPHPTGKLSFSVASSENKLTSEPKYQFDMNQNFTGWRALWVHFEEDAKVPDYKGSDKMSALSVTASSDMKNDEVYLDLMQFVSFVSRKRHSDMQFVNNKSKARVDSYIIHQPWLDLEQFKQQNPSDISNSQKAEIRMIESRLEQLILGSNELNLKGVKQLDAFNKSLKSKIKTANKLYKKLKIKRKGGVVTGLPLFSSRDEQPAKAFMNFQELTSSVFFPLAIDYKLSGPKDKKKKLKKLLNLFDHMEDQGWAAGSSVGTTDHIIRLSGYATAVFMIRNELQAAGKLSSKQQALDWHTRFGRLVELEYDKGENTDHVRGGALAKLVAVLVMPDSGEKVAKLKLFREYLSHVSGFAPGYSDTIKPDFSIFHHRGAYMASYGVQSLTTFAILNWLTADTQFGFSQPDVKRLQDTLLAQVDFAAGVEIHPGAAGRFPYKNSGLYRFLLPAYAFMADAQPGSNGNEMAHTFARLYDKANLTEVYSNFFPSLTYYGTLGTVELMDKVFKSTSTPYKTAATGNFSFPYAALMNHKRDNWAANVRGMSKYVWDFESGSKKENPFGRYMAYGALMLFSDGQPLSLEASGIDLDGGFHWGYVPGATTKALPMDKVAYEIKPDNKYLEGKHRNFSENTFVGGLSFGKNSGMFAMQFQDTVDNDREKVLFDDSFRFNKSFFFLGDEVIALGSDISNNDKRYDTVTTLFQSKLTGRQGLAVEQQNIAASKDVDTYTDGGIFADPLGNHYVVPKEYKVRLQQGEQASLVPSKGKSRVKSYEPLNSRHAKAYIDHGASPDDQGYEYLLLPKSERKVAQKRKFDKGYTVVQKDQKAHIIDHQTSGIVAYALFEQGNVDYGPLKQTDTPVMVMAKQQGDKLDLSIADPDLRLAKWNHNMSFMPLDIVNGASESHVVNITLDGQWHLKQAHPKVKKIKHQAGQTQIALEVADGLSQELELGSE